MIRSGGQKSLPAIGFLTVTRDDEQGLLGGYLVLNFLGRPLEFHCTAPVRPNRAQEILYGPTLEPYLYGERIGQALLEKSKAAPQVVLTDCPAVMVARLFAPTPMVLILGAASASSAAEAAVPTPVPALPGDVAANATRPAASCCGTAPLRLFELGGYHLAVHAEHADDQPHFVARWPHLADQIELDEPFSRIREAIDEARASAR
ncbi:MAG: hypothetical protein ACYC0X_01745 [Pirellulaceae bacterium]